MRSFWCHHGANYNTSSTPSLRITPRLKMSQYRSATNAYPPITSIKNNKPKESPLPRPQTITRDLETHYKYLHPSAREQALIRDLVDDWNDRRLLAYWKCLEHHPRRAAKIVRLMGLDFGEAKTDMLVKRALRNLHRYPREDRFLVVAKELEQVGNGDAVLGLDDPQYVLNCCEGSDDVL
jgi:hypothetical protein